MTANASTADRNDCLGAGMDAHIGKPFDIDEVANTLRQLTALVPPESTPGKRIARKPGLELDLQGALSRFQGKIDMYRRALNDFAIDAPRILERLSRQVDAQNVPDASAALHALKGIALTLGANGLASAFNQADPATASGKAIAQICDGDIFTDLAQQVVTTIEQIEVQLGFEDDSLRSNEAAMLHSSQLSALQRAEKMDILLLLLDSGNLRAVDLMEELAAGECAEPRVLKALEAVQRLRFAEAAALLRKQ